MRFIVDATCQALLVGTFNACQTGKHPQHNITLLRDDWRRGNKRRQQLHAFTLSGTLPTPTPTVHSTTATDVHCQSDDESGEFEVGR